MQLSPPSGVNGAQAKRLQIMTANKTRTAKIEAPRDFFFRANTATTALRQSHSLEVSTQLMLRRAIEANMTPLRSIYTMPETSIAPPAPKVSRPVSEALLNEKVRFALSFIP